MATPTGKEANVPTVPGALGASPVPKKVRKSFCSVIFSLFIYFLEFTQVKNSMKYSQFIFNKRLIQNITTESFMCVNKLYAILQSKIKQDLQ